MLRTEDARADATLVVEADGRYGRQVDAECRHGEQRVRRRIMYQHRGTACTDRLRDFSEDGFRRLVERDRASENLADGVKEIDFFVPFRELVCRVLDFER